MNWYLRFASAQDVSFLELHLRARQVLHYCATSLGSKPAQKCQSHPSGPHALRPPLGQHLIPQLRVVTTLLSTSLHTCISETQNTLCSTVWYHTAPHRGYRSGGASYSCPRRPWGTSSALSAWDLLSCSGLEPCPCPPAVGVNPCSLALRSSLRRLKAEGRASALFLRSKLGLSSVPAASTPSLLGARSPRAAQALVT